MKQASSLGITPDMAVSTARNIILDNLDNGVICPCCGQPAKRYRRSISSAMAYALLLMHNDSLVSGDRWIHLENFLKAQDYLPASVRGDVPKMRFWGLIEAKEGEKEDGNPNNGYYRITDLGHRFAKGNCTVSKYVFLYNNAPSSFSNEGINIHEAIKNKFSYKLLMENHV